MQNTTFSPARAAVTHQSPAGTAPLKGEPIGLPPAGEVGERERTRKGRRAVPTPQSPAGTAPLKGEPIGLPLRGRWVSVSEPGRGNARA